MATNPARFRYGALGIEDLQNPGMRGLVRGSKRFPTSPAPSAPLAPSVPSVAASAPPPPRRVDSFSPEGRARMDPGIDEAVRAYRNPSAPTVVPASKPPLPSVATPSLISAFRSALPDMKRFVTDKVMPVASAIAPVPAAVSLIRNVAQRGAIPVGKEIADGVSSAASALKDTAISAADRVLYGPQGAPAAPIKPPAPVAPVPGPDASVPPPPVRPLAQSPQDAAPVPAVTPPPDVRPDRGGMPPNASGSVARFADGNRVSLLRGTVGTPTPTRSFGVPRTPIGQQRFDGGMSESDALKFNASVVAPATNGNRFVFDETDAERNARSRRTQEDMTLTRADGGGSGRTSNDSGVLRNASLIRDRRAMDEGRRMAADIEKAKLGVLDRTAKYAADGDQATARAISAHAQATLAETRDKATVDRMNAALKAYEDRLKAIMDNSYTTDRRGRKQPVALTPQQKTDLYREVMTMYGFAKEQQQPAPAPAG